MFNRRLTFSKFSTCLYVISLAFQSGCSASGASKTDSESVPGGVEQNSPVSNGELSSSLNDNIEEAMQKTEQVVEPTTDTNPYSGSEICGAEINPVIGGNSGSGHATRYWDCCMPHCAWVENTSTTSKVCSVNNEVTALAISYEGGQPQTTSRSGCEQQDGVYTCYDQSPWAPCDDLAFGFAAVPLSGPDACGTCFHLEFDGRNQQVQYDQNAEPDPGSAQLLGKSMIVMASNTGGDVGSGQFDIMIPGGGLGIFQQGCQNQWGDLDESIYGATYGGMREACRAEFQTAQEQSGQYLAHMPLDQMQSCVKTRCDRAFSADPAQAHLLSGCEFYADWMGAADNPTFSYRQVECPQALIERY